MKSICMRLGCQCDNARRYKDAIWTRHKNHDVNYSDLFTNTEVIII